MDSSASIIIVVAAAAAAAIIIITIIIIIIIIITPRVIHTLMLCTLQGLCTCPLQLPAVQIRL
jgi:hypothetical protein